MEKFRRVIEDLFVSKEFNEISAQNNLNCSPWKNQVSRYYNTAQEGNDATCFEGH